MYLATIEILENAIQAHVTRALLESEGIPAFLTNENYVTALWPLSNALGGIRVQVPEEFVPQAATLLKLRDSGALQEALSSQEGIPQTVCSNCGNTEFEEKADLSLKLLTCMMYLFCSAPFPPPKIRACLKCGATQSHEA